MDLGGLVFLIVMTPLLAAIGITTLAAFALMAVLGLLSDLSFKRLFFVSFAMGLAAPLLLAGAIFAGFEDGSFERDLRDGLDQVLVVPEDQGGPPAGLIPALKDLRADLEDGNLSESEIEQRIEGLFEGREGVTIRTDGAPIDGNGVVDGVEITRDADDGEEVTVEIDGVQLSQDGDRVQITID